MHLIFRRIYSVTGVIPLLLFLILNFSFSAVILFSTRETVQTLISFQSHLVIALLEICLITLPLLFHYFYGLLLLSNQRMNVHNYPYSANWRFVCSKVSGVIVLIFLLYQTVQLVQIFSNQLLGYQYIQTLMKLHESVTSMIVFWGVMACASFYFCNSLWEFVIDWGIAAARPSQKFFSRLFMLLFFVLFGLIGAIVTYQLMIRSIL